MSVCQSRSARTESVGFGLRCSQTCPHERPAPVVSSAANVCFILSFDCSTETTVRPSGLLLIVLEPIAEAR